MYLVDEEVMQLVLSNVNVRTFGVLYPSMTVVKLQSVTNKYQRMIKRLIGDKEVVTESYTRDVSEHVVVHKVDNRLEAYYPYKLDKDLAEDEIII